MQSEKKWLVQGWAKVCVLNSASGQPGGRPQNSRFLHHHQTTLPSNKTNPMSWFWTFENGRNVTGQNLRFPWLFDYLQIHIRFTYHSPLICQHLNLFACRVSDENLKATLICTACGKPLPGSLCPAEARGTCTHSPAPKQAYSPTSAHTQHHQPLV